MELAVAPVRSYSDELPTRPPDRRLVVALLVTGVVLFLFCVDWSAAGRNAIQFGAAGAAMLVALIPPVNRMLGRGLARLGRPSRRTVGLATLVISGASAWYFLDTAARQDRVLVPKYHDEQMYAIQAQLVARGRLWMPQHPLADFFETFHVMVKPVYAPIYFPGTAMLFAPSVWLNLPLAWVSALIAGAIVGLCYRVATSLFDGVGGLLAAVMAVALPTLHFISVMVMSHGAALFLSLVTVWAWLRWRPRRRWGWAVMIGAAAGWAAITRPFDALCFAAPVAVAMGLQLRGLPVGTHLRTAAALAAGMIPFLAVQGILDVGTTGHLFKTPAGVYAQTYWPGAGMGFKPADPAFRPPTRLIQFQEYYDQRLVPDINVHAKLSFVRAVFCRVLPAAVRGGVPSPALLILLPVGLLGLVGRHRWVMAVPAIAFTACYAFYPFILPHYTLVAAPAVITCVLAGLFTLRRLAPGAAVAATVGVVAACLTSLHELNPAVHDPNFGAPFLVDIDEKLDEIREPAVVLFRYPGGGDFDEEPVYNTTAAWPDDAPVIRAHDLGAENARLFTYYAKIDPDRAVYRYDRSTLVLQRLGTARELAAKSHG